MPIKPIATEESSVGQFQPLCQLDELSDGQGRSFVVNDQVIGLFRIGNEVYALDDRCPHAGASLAHGYVEGDVVRCRIHHWGFRLCDGSYVDEDRPNCNARSIPVRVVSGTVEVLSPE